MQPASPARPAPTAGPILAALALCLSAAGCGSDPDKPPLGTVSGKVTYKGEPLPAGSIIFSPSGGGTGQPANGTLGSDGSYRLTTFEEGDGAILGDHVVTIQSNEETISKKPANAEAIQVTGPDGKLGYRATRSRIPQKYTRQTESPLRFKVEAGSNRYDIDLTD